MVVKVIGILLFVVLLATSSLAANAQKATNTQAQENPAIAEEDSAPQQNKAAENQTYFLLAKAFVDDAQGLRKRLGEHRAQQISLQSRLRDLERYGLSTSGQEQEEILKLLEATLLEILAMQASVSETQNLVESNLIDPTTLSEALVAAKVNSQWVSNQVLKPFGDLLNPSTGLFKELLVNVPLYVVAFGSETEQDLRRLVFGHLFSLEDKLFAINRAVNDLSFQEYVAVGEVPADEVCRAEGFETSSATVIVMKSFAGDVDGLNLGSDDALSFAKLWVENLPCNQADSYIQEFKLIRDYAYAYLGLSLSFTASTNYAFDMLPKYCGAADFFPADFDKYFSYATNPQGLNMSVKDATAYAKAKVEEAHFRCQGRWPDLSFRVVVE